MYDILDRFAGSSSRIITRDNNKREESFKIVQFGSRMIQRTGCLSRNNGLLAAITRRRYPIENIFIQQD